MALTLNSFLSIDDSLAEVTADSGDSVVAEKAKETKHAAACSGNYTDKADHVAAMLKQLTAYGASESKKILDNNEKNKQERIKKRALEVSAERNSKSPIPARYRNASLVVDCNSPLSYQKKEKLISYYEIAIKYVDQFQEIIDSSGRGMILWGGVGSGKTQMACAIGLELSKNGRSVLYAATSDIIAKMGDSKSFSKPSIDSGIGRNGRNEAYTLNSYSEADLLIIDELRSLSQYEKNIITAIVDLRYRNMLPTIVISNLGPDHLRLAVGDVLFSRLSAHGAAIINFDIADMRNDCFDNGYFCDKASADENSVKITEIEGAAIKEDEPGAEIDFSGDLVISFSRHSKQ